MSRPRHSGDDPLDAIGAAAAALAEHDDPAMRRIAAQLFDARAELAGGRSEVPLAVRNEHFKAAAEHQDFADLAPPERVRAVARALRRYYPTGWRFDRLHDTCPHPPDSVRALLWLALKAVPREVGETQLRRIILGR
jgi:hypothetical protein